MGGWDDAPKARGLWPDLVYDRRRAALYCIQRILASSSDRIADLAGAG